MKHLSKEELIGKIKSLKLKIGVIVNSTSIVKQYMSEVPEEEKSKKFDNLLKAGYKITQSDIDEFKEEEWFQKYFYEISKRVLRNEKNLDFIYNYITSNVNDERNVNDGRYFLINLILSKTIVFNQTFIDKFKYLDYFSSIFFEYAPEKLLLDPINEQILNHYFTLNEEITRNIKNKELLLKMIKANAKFLYVDNKLLKENNYELFNLLVEKNINFYIKDKDICLKVIELKNQHMFEHFYSELLSDKELYIKAKKNGLDTKDRDIINKFDIEFLEQCVKDGLNIDLSSYRDYTILYNNPILKEVLLKNFDTYKMRVLINNGIDIDFDIDFSKMYEYMSIDAIIKYADKLKNLQINWWAKVAVFQNNDNFEENKNGLKEIIKRGFINILANIPEEYVDEEILILAIENGLCEKSIINHYINIMNNILTFDRVEKLCKNILEKNDYDGLNFEKEPLIRLKINDSDTDDIKERKEKIINNLLFNSLITSENIFQIKSVMDLEYFDKFVANELYNRILNETDVNAISNFFSNIFSSFDDYHGYNIREKGKKYSDLVDKYYDLFYKYYDDNKIDLNVMKLQRDSDISKKIFAKKENVEKEIINGFAYIFSYIDLCEYNDMEYYIKFAVKNNYKSSGISQLLINYLNNNPLLLSDIVKICPDYFKYIKNHIVIEANIDLILKNLPIDNRYIEKYLAINNDLYKGKSKILTPLYCLTDLNNKSNRDIIIQDLNKWGNNPTLKNFPFIEIEEEIIANINNPEYEELIITTIKNSNNLLYIEKIIDAKPAILDKLIEDNVSYIKYASEEYIKNHQEYLLQKIVENNIVEGLKYDFVRSYIYNINDVYEAIRICKLDKAVIGYFNPNFIKQNEFLALRIKECDLSDENVSVLLTDYEFVKKYIPSDSKAFKKISSQMLREHPDLLENCAIKNNIFSSPFGAGLFEYFEDDFEQLFEYDNLDIPSELSDEYLDKIAHYLVDKYKQIARKEILKNTRLFIKLLKMGAISSYIYDSVLSEELLEIILSTKPEEFNKIEYKFIPYSFIVKHYDFFEKRLNYSEYCIELFRNNSKYRDYIEQLLKSQDNNIYYSEFFKYLKYEDVKNSIYFIIHAIECDNIDVINKVKNDINVVINLINNKCFTILQFINNKEIVSNELFVDALRNNNYYLKYYSYTILNNKKILLDCINLNANIIDNLPDFVLSGEENEIIIAAIDNGYEMSIGSNHFVCENEKYIIRLYKKAQSSYTKEVIIGQINPKVFLNENSKLFDLLLSDESINYSVLIEAFGENNYILNNLNYVTKIVNHEIEMLKSFKEFNKFKSIFNYISLNNIDENIKNIIIENMSLLSSFILKPELLKDKDIFDSFKEYNMKVAIDNGPIEFITENDILYCMINNIFIPKESELLKNKAFAKLYESTDENIRLAIERGIKVDVLSDRVLKADILKSLIKKDLIDVTYLMNMMPNFLKTEDDFNEICELIIKKGYLISGTFADIISPRPDIIKEKNDVLLFHPIYSLRIFGKEKINSIVSNDKILDACFTFIDSTKNWENYDFIRRRDDIYKYFDEFGPTKLLYDQVLCNIKLLNHLFTLKDYRIVNNYSDELEVIQYFKFIEKNGAILHNYVNNKNDIYNYFTKNGYSNLLENLILFNDNFFYIYFQKNNYQELNYPEKVKQYIKLRYESKFHFDIHNFSEIDEYFDDNGPKKVLFVKALTNSMFFDALNRNGWLESVYENDPSIITYINYVKKYGQIFTKVFNIHKIDDIYDLFDKDGYTENLKNILRDNSSATANFLSYLAHNDQVLNNLSMDFVNMFEYYLLDKYFNNSKEKYDYLFSKIGPKLLFNFDNNILKLIDYNIEDMQKFFSLFEFKKGIIPEQETYNNFVVSLCNMSFDKKYSYIVDIFTHIRELIEGITDIDGFINGTSNGGLDNSLYDKLTSIINEIIRTLNIDKSDIYDAIREYKKKEVNTDPLHDICNKYITECRKNYLKTNGDTILSTIGISPTMDTEDAIKKFCNHLLNTMTYDNFRFAIENIKTKINYETRKGFIDEIKMTKEEFDILISISREQYLLIKDAIINKKAPDNSVKKQFSLFKRFIMQYSKFSIENNLVTSSELNALNVNKKYQIELEEIDYIKILSEINLDVLFNYDEDIFKNLMNTIKSYRLGAFPSLTTNSIKRNYDITLSDGINNIGLFITRYLQLLKNKRARLRKLGQDVELKDIRFSFEEIVKLISSVNNETYELKRLIGSEEYLDFINNASPNSNGYSRLSREEKMGLIVDYLYTLSEITIPSHDMILENDDGKQINFIVGNRTNPSNICHGERTGACMRVGGVGEGLFLKCLTDKNWFHIRIEDPETHEFVSRVSGFRNGNTVYLNQLRSASANSKYTNEDLTVYIEKYAKMLIEETKNSEFPIENVFINTGYAMLGYNNPEYNGRVYNLGSIIQSDYNLNGVKYLGLSLSEDIWTDVRNNAILLATTEEGSKTPEGYAPLKNGPENTEIYECARDKIYGLNDIDDDIPKHIFVIVASESLIEKINRVHAMKEKLLGKDYQYEIVDIAFDDLGIIDGYVSSDWYVYIDSNYEIHSDYISEIKNNEGIISYTQASKAKEEMEYYKNVLINKYNLSSEVKHAI